MREWLGRRLGQALGPLLQAGARLRDTRLLHPEGLVGLGRVRALEEEGVLGLVGRRVAGHALLRFAPAWWRDGREGRDVLGVGLRLRADPKPTVTPAGDDQDLLFATIRSPFTSLLAPLSTQVHHFLDNDFYAVSPFDVDRYGRAKLRLVSRRAPVDGANRRERLEDAIDRGQAVLTFELRRVGPATPWEPVAEITVQRLVEVDQQSLRFWPFRDGRGIRPKGFVHAVHRGVYENSQAARPERRAGARPPIRARPARPPRGPEERRIVH